MLRKLKSVNIVIFKYETTVDNKNNVVTHSVTYSSLSINTTSNKDATLDLHISSSSSSNSSTFNHTQRTVNINIHQNLRVYFHTRISGVTSYGALGHVPPSTSNNFVFSFLWSKSDSQLFKYCVVCEISWGRCQQLAALSISTALVTKLLVIEQLLHPALKSAVSAPWPNFQLCWRRHWPESYPNTKFL